MVGQNYYRPPLKTASEYKPATQTEFTESLGEYSNKIVDPVGWWAFLRPIPVFESRHGFSEYHFYLA